MDSTNLLYVLAILALAVAVVVLLLRFMRARHVAVERRADAPAAREPARAEPPSKDEQEYLDSSHISGPILPGGADALETWRKNQRK